MDPTQLPTTDRPGWLPNELIKVPDQWQGGQEGRIWPCGSVMRSLGGGTGAASPWRGAPRGRKSPVGKWWWWLPASDLQRFDTRKGWRGEGRLRVSSFPPSRSNGGYSRGPPLASLKCKRPLCPHRVPFPCSHGCFQAELVVGMDIVVGGSPSTCTCSGWCSHGGRSPQAAGL